MKIENIDKAEEIRRKLSYIEEILKDENDNMGDYTKYFIQYASRDEKNEIRNVFVKIKDELLKEVEKL